MLRNISFLNWIKFDVQLFFCLILRMKHLITTMWKQFLCSMWLKVIWNDILTILSYIREWVHKCLFNKTDIVFWIFYAKCERHSRSKLLNREKEHWLTRLTSLAYDVSKTQSPYKAMLWIQISMSFCSILKEKKYYFI